MKITNIFKVKSKAEETQTENTTETEDVLLKALMAGETITREKAMTIPVISSCVGFICDTFAMIPFKLYEEEEKDGKKVTKEIKDNRVNLINDDTKDTLDGFQFKKAMCEDYLLGKGGYSYIKKKLNSFTKLNYIEETQISILKNTDPFNKQFEILVNGTQYKEYDFIKFLRNTKDGASGKGLVSQINEALQTAYQRIKLENDLMKTCGSKKGFLLAKKHLDKTAMEQLKKAWNDYYSGNSSCVILNDGMEFKEASNTSVENQLNEKTKTFADEMKELFHCNGTHDEIIKKCIMPIAIAFATALNKSLLLESEKDKKYFAPDMTELLKGSLKERYEAYKIAVRSGWMTRNEVRYKEDMDQLNGLDVINLGLGDVLLNPETGEIYTPNTNNSKQINSKIITDTDKDEGGE